MKKYVFLFIISIIINNNVYNQYVPNGGFENWTVVDLFDNPDDWHTGNIDALFSGDSIEELTAIKTEDSYSGDYALELVSVITNPPDEDTIFGYAICEGQVNGEGDSLIYVGGFPVSGNPESLCGYFKYSIVDQDTAYILCAFKKDGVVLLEEYVQIFGEQASYAKIVFDLHADTLPVTIDTVVIAFACSDFNNPKEGNSIIIDSLWLTGITDTIPNYDFEDWTFLSYEDPDEWQTTNFFYLAFGNDSLCATKSTDSYAGQYALRLENNVIEQMNMILSVATTSDDIFDIEPTIPIYFNPSSLQGYYKYISPESDSATIGVLLYGKDEFELDYQMMEGTILTESADYQLFEIPIDIPHGVTISHAGIIIIPGKNNFMSDTSIAGSVLFIDELELIDPCTGMEAVNLIEFDDTTICLGDVVILDAGSGYDDYLWSTAETTQAITVNAPDEYGISVWEGLCEIRDTVVVYTEICGSVKDEISNQESIRVYPNPGYGILTVELPFLYDNKISLQVFDILGHEVYSEIIETSNNIFKFNLSDIEPGIYNLKINTEKEQYLQKIFIY